jgi:hypothetical protein
MNKNYFKSRTTVNGLRISYDQETDEIIFEKNGSALALKMGEDELDLLYNMTPYWQYRRALLQKQEFQCADCGKPLERKQSAGILHHEPKKGQKGSRYVDFKGLTKNRILCKDCHDRIPRSRELGA